MKAVTFINIREWCFSTEISIFLSFTYICDGINLRDSFIISRKLVYLDAITN